MLDWKKFTRKKRGFSKKMIKEPNIFLIKCLKFYLNLLLFLNFLISFNKMKFLCFLIFVNINFVRFPRKKRKMPIIDPKKRETAYIFLNIIKKIYFL